MCAGRCYRYEEGSIQGGAGRGHSPPGHLPPLGILRKRRPVPARGVVSASAIHLPHPRERPPAHSLFYGHVR